MNMFDKNNELSMLLLEKLAHEDFESNRLYWNAVKFNVVSGFYDNINISMSRIAEICHMRDDKIQYLRTAFISIYKMVLMNCNKSKREIDVPVTVDWLKERYIEYLREEYGDTK